MKHFSLLIALFFVFTTLNAQLENVIVEKYYISDANDAVDIEYITDLYGNVTDTVKLEEGSTTYRIYVQLASGYMLTKIFGDADHALKFEGQGNFFNNINLGITFGKDLVSSRFHYNTVALDTWLTMGQAARTYSGVLKAEDTDGSIIGGTNNDAGMLVNNDPIAGIPLTQEDGLLPTVNTPMYWLQSGFVNTTGDDTTIFGSLKISNHFVSNNCFLQSSGVTGVMPDNNKILVAQLTTKGDLSFELNIQLQKTDGSSTINLVAKKAPGDDAKGYVVSQYLSYPQASVCGCTDPNYLEYNSFYTCSNPDSCKTKMICGCMDPQACNYDPTANYSIPSLCCYPGFCNNRDISVVCPDLKNDLDSKFAVYPNPMANQAHFEINSHYSHVVKMEIFNSFGQIVTVRNINAIDGKTISDMDLSNLEHGLYVAVFYEGNKTDTKTFIKK